MPSSCQKKQKEDIEFNKQKLLKKKAAAFRSGSLLPNEADDTVKAAVQESNKKKKTKHAERLNENTHRADFVDARPLCPDELKSKTVFVEKDVEKARGRPSDICGRASSQRGLSARGC